MKAGKSGPRYQMEHRRNIEGQGKEKRGFLQYRLGNRQPCFDWSGLDHASGGGNSLDPMSEISDHFSVLGTDSREQLLISQ